MNSLAPCWEPDLRRFIATGMESSMKPLYTLPNPPTPMMKISSKLFVAALISAIVKQRHRWAGKDSDPSYFVFDDLSFM
ncbi:hypothetical protein A2U01_0059300, partial [Trifolium medium]|nr:hypothetical protein [Trifolium medium]